eukprot:gnl/Trimastix_PCT/1449.p1 GENE.gnl/Trimastix_PCT/1449~~gnl/Trimastix_PCT/1449.p1  ORF type:complete len:457 (+),score=132.25 gnl/Trimastix_PCT/1449:121-1491(+)
MRTPKLILALCFLVIAAKALDFMEVQEGNAIPHYWDQKLDHFAFSTITWRQKYYYDDSSFIAPNGPIFLTIGGEAPLHGVAGGFPKKLAQKFGGMVVSLEHRYYGESQPFSNLSTENLKYLSVEQELEDLAHFAKWFQEHHINMRYGTHGMNKWVIIGGSYAGMVSCETRQTHPEIFVASLSSSGVVDAVLDYTDFDNQIGITLGEECAKLVRESMEEIDSKLDGSPAMNREIKAYFNATGMNDFDFRYMLGDAIALGPQYGNREALCTPMIEANNQGRPRLPVFRDFCNSFFYPRFCQGKGPYLYSDEWMTRTEPVEASSQRVWWYQKCTQLAYFQNYPGKTGLRSPKLDMEGHRQKCQNVFGSSIAWPPKTREFNRRYGALHPRVTNVIFTQGSQDPWQWAGVRHNLAPNNMAFVMTGPNVGHCRDLHADSPRDPPDVTRTRERIVEQLGRWLQ